LNLSATLLFRKLWTAIVWALFILILVGTPGQHIPEITSFWEWIGFDKIVHVLIFAPFTFLILNGVRQQYLVSSRRYLYALIAVGVSLAYGLLTEVLQAHVFVGRYGNAFDFYADSIGAIVGWLGFVLVNRKKNKAYSNTKQD